MADNRTTVDQFISAMDKMDIEAQERLLSDDFVDEYPQSGEVTRGNDKRRASMENYPGGTPRETSASRPNPKPPIVTGAGDNFTASGQITYPNGETWHVISLIELRDGKIRKMTSFFAAPFEAPAWRASYVEKGATATKSR